MLLIDDSDMALDFQTKLLARFGFEVRSCSQLCDVRERVDGWRPAAIVTDVDLPEAENTDVLGFLRADPGTNGVPVVLCSGLPLEDLERLASERSADGFVSKSDNIQALPEEVRRVLSVK